VKRQVAVREPLPLRGEIELVIRGGARVRRIAVRNTILYTGRNALLYLLAQTSGAPTDWKLARLIPGTNGTPPTPGDVGAFAPVSGPDQIVLTSPDVVVSPGTGELIVTGTLLTTQANGQDLREIVLAMGNGEPFARQVHPTVSKDSPLTVTYTWRIAVTS